MLLKQTCSPFGLVCETKEDGEKTSERNGVGERRKKGKEETEVRTLTHRREKEEGAVRNGTLNQERQAILAGSKILQGEFDSKSRLEE